MLADKLKANLIIENFFRIERSFCFAVDYLDLQFTVISCSTKLTHIGSILHTVHAKVESSHFRPVH